MESENYNQILDARKLLTRQLSKMEKLSYENEFNLNQPTLSPSDHEKSEPKFDPILEEVENESESQEDHECQEYPRRRPSSNYSLSINIPGPLTPSYQPTLVVTNVWNNNMSMQRLYRYTTMQGIIY